MERSWQQLELEAAAKRRVAAQHTLELMVACQGDAKSWNKLREKLTAVLKHE